MKRNEEEKSTVFNGRFWIDRNAHVFLGPGRVQLLEQIDSGNSIAEAARQLGMGYKTAWDMLNDMNNLSEHPLVIRTKGGRHGGGTTLTEYGQQMIQTYRAIEREYQAMLLLLEQRFPELSHWQKLEQRLQLRTSARNQLFCTVQSLEKNGHRILAVLNLGEKQFLHAYLTQTSVDELGLSVGQQVIALIKATLITLSVQPAEDAHSVQGVLKQVDLDDAGGAEAEVLLKGGQTLIATVEDGAALANQVEKPVYAEVDPKHVILATF